MLQLVLDNVALLNSSFTKTQLYGITTIAATMVMTPSVYSPGVTDDNINSMSSPSSDYMKMRLFTDVNVCQHLLMLKTLPCKYKTLNVLIFFIFNFQMYIFIFNIDTFLHLWSNLNRWNQSTM